MLKKDLIKEVDKLKKQLAKREEISAMHCRRFIKLHRLTKDIRNAVTKYNEDTEFDE